MLSLLASLAMTVAPVSAGACSADRAVRATVAEIGEKLDHFLGRCVTVAGPFSSNSVYGRVEDMYLIDRYRLDGNRDPLAVRRGRLGVYSMNMVPPSPRGVRHVEVTGTIDSCERIHAKATANALARGDLPIILIGGYCHYYAGAVFHVTSSRIDPRRFYARLLGDRARLAYGNLVAMPARWPLAARIEDAGGQFLGWLRSGDRESLERAHNFQPDNEYYRDVMSTLLDRTDSPFAEVRANRNLPVQAFIRRIDWERWRQGKTPDSLHATLCVCRTGDCRGRWPISSNDADNAPRRPYACTTMNGVIGKGGTPAHQTPRGEPGYLGEPATTAFRRR